mmetsp:Transcript_2081/g.3807  ORF Transcript_2081/g.3807 Transcript_2081/m.3807 type:complete len:259 (-) Transcript_2081:53-829(-)
MALENLRIDFVHSAHPHFQIPPSHKIEELNRNDAPNPLAYRANLNVLLPQPLLHRKLHILKPIAGSDGDFPPIRLELANGAIREHDRELLVVQLLRQCALEVLLQRPQPVERCSSVVVHTLEVVEGDRLFDQQLPDQRGQRQGHLGARPHRYGEQAAQKLEHRQQLRGDGAGIQQVQVAAFARAVLAVGRGHQQRGGVGHDLLRDLREELPVGPGEAHHVFAFGLDFESHERLGAAGTHRAELEGGDRAQLAVGGGEL